MKTCNKHQDNIVECYCPHCNQKLTTNYQLIDGLETVWLFTKIDKQRIDIFLSAIWGKFKKKTMNGTLYKGIILNLFCPHCKKELNIENPKCSCGAPLVELKCEKGILGMALICSRVGCYNHKIQPDKIPGDTPSGS